MSTFHKCIFYSLKLEILLTIPASNELEIVLNNPAAYIFEAAS